MIKYINISLLLVGLFNFCCNNNYQPSDKVSNSKIRTNSGIEGSCKIVINDLKEKILKMPLSKLNDLNGCFIIKDTLMYGDDDDTFWKAIAYYKNQRLSFIAETNLTDNIYVSRITIIDSTIKSQNGISVGSDLKSMKPFINLKPGSNPDGYLSFFDKNDSTINYYMDVSKYPLIANGQITDINKMATNIKVNRILVNVKY